MSNSSRDSNIREKFRQALQSTFNVISDDLKVNKKDKFIKKSNFPEIELLNTKSSFVKARADMDTLALKKRFSDENIYKKKVKLVQVEMRWQKNQLTYQLTPEVCLTKNSNL